jgi:hypothetical protein
VAAIKEKLSDKQSENFIWTATSWVTYNANPRAVDAVADLCAADELLCPLVIKKLLNNAAARDRHYEIAYYAIERHPNLLAFVTTWVTDSMKWSMSARDLGRELVKRESAGHPIREDDPILSRLPTNAKQLVERAVENARREDRPNRNH